jgi:hypothetical protein
LNHFFTARRLGFARSANFMTIAFESPDQPEVIALIAELDA